MPIEKEEWTEIKISFEFLAKSAFKGVQLMHLIEFETNAPLKI